MARKNSDGSIQKPSSYKIDLVKCRFVTSCFQICPKCFVPKIKYRKFFAVDFVLVFLAENSKHVAEEEDVDYYHAYRGKIREIFLF